MALAAVESKARRKAWSKKNALAAEPQWSQYQSNVFDAVENGEGNLQIGAVAGSGKSTLIAAIVARLPIDAKIQILAFNKHIVDAMKPKLPTRVGVTTAHSMGNSLLAREFEGVPIVDNGKYRKIARPLIAAIDANPFVQELDPKARKNKLAIVRRNWMKFALNLVRGCHSTLCSPDVPDLRDLIKYYGIDTPIGGELITPLIKSILEIGDQMARDRQVIDFGDMLWLPYRWELQPVSKDWLLIDEVQDANRAQLHLYEKCGRNGRVIVVGDEDQAIQGFAFAAPQMWQEIADRFNAKKMPLSVCYRCPTSHLDLARYFVPAIEPASAAKEGDVSVIHPDMVGSLVELGDLILCRFTAPLISACFDLMKRGIPAKIRGRDTGVNLARLADVGEPNWPIFTDVIVEIMGAEIAKFRAEDDDRADSIKDDMDCIFSMHHHLSGDCSSLAEFIEKIESVFSDHASPVTLSTIHRSKGDEADRVFILMSNAIPYRRDGMMDWQLKQEDHLAYVALTRAKQSLVFVPIGRDAAETNSFMDDPHGGIDVFPVPFNPEIIDDAVNPASEVESTIAPYAVGDRFNYLYCGPHEITDVIASGGAWEYKADYKGDRNQRYWKCDSYSHSSIEIVNT